MEVFCSAAPLWSSMCTLLCLSDIFFHTLVVNLSDAFVSDILSATRRDGSMKIEPGEPLKAPLTSVAFPSFPNAGMFTPSQLLMASQLMAASGLGLQHSNPAAFFHPSLFAAAAWPQANSPPSPTSASEQLSPALKTRKHNHNNNVVSSSSTESKVTIQLTFETLLQPFCKLQSLWLIEGPSSLRVHDYRCFYIFQFFFFWLCCSDSNLIQDTFGY